MTHDAYIGLGSNIGNRAAHLNAAISLINDSDRIEVVRQSSIYETDPVGFLDQQSFLNMVIKVKTDCSPCELLEEMQAIEQQCGRTREVKWGPRTIDLDILLYDQENMKMENLIIPHPRMWERAFVLIPLMEIAPTIKVEGGQSVQAIYEWLADKGGVKKWDAF